MIAAGEVVDAATVIAAVHMLSGLWRQPGAICGKLAVLVAWAGQGLAVASDPERFALAHWHPG